ncbi:NAD(P)-binding protein [Rhodotorula diobovata]|uniref:NAD(P)-binding protein n=1 Tax=Rhodotorula diobovata TaxID=5288 RepID=A0A5C5FQY9_9BASI|nr:NAD(P)-binding protein [Rhodotorula diobovata]
MVVNASLIFADVPTGAPVPGKHLKRVEEELDVAGVDLQGGILVRLTAASYDPYMKGRMRGPERKSYNQPFTLGAPLDTLAVGVVERSDVASIPKGAIFKGLLPFSEYAVISKARLDMKLGKVIENPEGLAWTTLVGAAGMPGATAWVGLYDIGKIQKGDTLFITAASGAVGQIAGQLAKRDGLTVIGSAGSDDKVAFLKEIGFDVAFNYKTTSTQEVLEQHPPTVVFENVGGETLDTILDTIQPKGRIIACGAVSQYNVPFEQRYGVKNTSNVVTKRLRYEGFIVSNHDQTEFDATMPKLIANGEIKIKEHVSKGIDNGEAFLDMLEGRNFGKAVVSFE